MTIGEKTYWVSPNADLNAVFSDDPVKDRLMRLILDEVDSGDGWIMEFDVRRRYGTVGLGAVNTLVKQGQMTTRPVTPTLGSSERSVTLDFVIRGGPSDYNEFRELVLSQVPENWELSDYEIREARHTTKGSDGLRYPPGHGLPHPGPIPEEEEH